MKFLETLSAKIHKINARGLGEVLDKNGQLILEMPFSLPGEIVDYKLDDLGHTNWMELKSSSPYRKKALCPQFKKCGGCSLQHATEEFVTDWKKTSVVSALEQRQLYPQFLNTFVTPERSRRRAVFSGRRTKTGTIVGFNSLRSERIVPILGCIILENSILSFLTGMEKITARACTRTSTIKIHVANSDNGLDVLVAAGRPLDIELRKFLTSIAVEYNLARLSWDGELIVSMEPPAQMLGEIKIIPPVYFFMQATKEAEIAMIKDVCKALENEKVVADLFSGFGTFSLPLSKTKRVLAYEHSSDMLSSLDLASRQAPNLKEIKTEFRDLHKNPVLRAELSELDGAVVNPPRSGAYLQCKELAKSGVQTIVLVSCNLTTFIRDTEILIKGNYDIDWVRVIDQFRWSHHIEIIARLSQKIKKL